ncbi:MAG: hypothetical protein EOP87_06255 [Verrucomicrobiaceae bacterium]|nr:MAG: hypothetical protein EOP87_06255 [Verrucomicrobiaceae bacterium]
MALAVAYVGSYLLYSKNGIYVPMGFGAGKGPQGKMVLRSKRIGLIWEPFGLPRSIDENQSFKIREMVYLPLVKLDRWIWHQRLPETEESYYSDYF